MRRQVVTACAALAAILGPGAGSAAAQDGGGGLKVDPGSPSGREYAVPLDDARRHGAPGPRVKRVTPGVAESAPAFGEGVGSGNAPSASGTSDRGRGAARPRGDRSEGTDGRDGATAPTRDRADVRPPPASRAAASVTDLSRTSDDDTGSGQVAAIGGAGVGVLLLGAAAGLVLRRRSG